MPVPRDRDELEAAVRAAHAGFVRELERVEQADAAALPCVERWTIKDVVAVRVAWAEMTRAWIEAGLRGESPPTPAEGYSWRETPALNAAIVAREAATPLPMLRERLDAAVAALLALAAALDDADLLEPHRFAWTRDWSVLRWIALNSASQQSKGRTLLRRALRAAAAEPAV